MPQFGASDVSCHIYYVTGLKGIGLFDHMCMLRKRMEGKYKGIPALNLETSKDNFAIMYRDVKQDLTAGLLMREAASGGKHGKAESSVV